MKPFICYKILPIRLSPSLTRGIDYASIEASQPPKKMSFLKTTDVCFKMSCQSNQVAEVSGLTRQPGLTVKASPIPYKNAAFLPYT